MAAIGGKDAMARLRGHADYQAAKAGNREAAVRLITDIMDDGMTSRVSDAFGTDAVFVAPHAEEAGGRNVIPNAMAFYLSERLGAGVDDGIVQTSRAFHTGARPLDRLLGRPTFEGPVEAGRRYVLVDDVTVMGGTSPNWPITFARPGARWSGR